MQNEADMQARQYQAQVQMEMQAREEQARMARLALPITQQEQMRNQAKMNGILEIERMVSEGTMTKEQGGLARLELLGEVNAFNDRMKYQQGQHYQQQAQLETQRFELANKNQMMAEGAMSEMAKRGVYSWYETDPRTGETHFNVFNPKTGEIYNPRSAGGRGEDKYESVGPYDDGNGGFSYKKALPEAKAEAEAAYPVSKGEDGKDANAQKRSDYMQEVMGRYQNEHRAGMHNKAQNRGGPVTAPQQQGQPQQATPQMQAESQLIALRNQYPDPSKAPPAIQQQMRALYQQYKSQ